MEPIKEQTNNTDSGKIQQKTPKEQSTHTNNPCNGNPYTGNPYPQSVSSIEKKPDTIYTQKLKEHFPFFSLGSLLYAVFYTFCLYKNASGITYPFFVAGTLYYFFFSMKKLGVPYKKDSIFYVISIILLGISNCFTNSDPILFLNKCGLFLFSFVLMIHTVYADINWNLPKYFSALAQTFGTVFTSVFRPLSDMFSYFDAKRHDKTDKKNYFLPVMAGIAITIPVLLFVTVMLASADAVFSSIINRILVSFHFSALFEILFMILLVFFISYAVYAALCLKNIKEEAIDRRTCEPIIVIILTTTLSILYMVFSIIQILYLFIGNMQLPDGYTYSSYAREGFFQLLTVCILNLLIVLVCLYFFRENTLLKIILTIMSGCTFIMILSSSLRMLMYINRYNLTFLRIFVLWSLAVIFLLMAGVTVSIYMNRFPLFTYCTAVITILYLALSFAHPDYWIAKYNLNPSHLEYLDEYDTFDNRKYLSKLSSDAAPIILNEEYNPYLKEIVSHSNHLDIGNLLNNWENENPHNDKEADMAKELSWIHIYYDDVKKLFENMYIRNFNFSIYRAGKHL